MSAPPPKQPTEKKMDPGWNDPPMLNYSSTNPPPKSRITNKRVAFPISGMTPPSNPSSSSPPSGDNKTDSNPKSPPKN